MSSLNKTLSKLEINIDNGEQYSRRMCLRIDGIDLKSDENELEVLVWKSAKGIRGNGSANTSCVN